MKLYLASIFLFLLNFSTSSSFAQEVKSANQEISFRPILTNTGLIFGSLSFPNEKANYNGYFLRFRYITDDKKLARKNSREIRISPKQIWKMKHQGELDNGLTYVFALDLAEGDYEIAGIRLFSNSGFTVLQSNTVFAGFSIPFHVTKGEVKYAGNLFFDEDSGGDITSIIQYKNAFAKDLAAIKVAQPFILWNDAVDSDFQIIYNN